MIKLILGIIVSTSILAGWAGGALTLQDAEISTTYIVTTLVGTIGALVAAIGVLFRKLQGHSEKSIEGLAIAVRSIDENTKGAKELRETVQGQHDILAAIKSHIER